MDFKYRYTDTELKKLLAGMTVIVDTREQENQHIIDYFEKNKILYEVHKLDAGDYGVKLPTMPDMGLTRDIFPRIAIEKKNSVDELAGSFKDRTRFENEFIRAQGTGTRIFLLVEDPAGYENIIKGNYRSQYEAKALLASLKAFESRYNFTTAFVDKKLSGNWIYWTLRSCTRELLI